MRLARRTEVERQRDALGRPRRVRGIAFPLPFECRLGRSDLETGELKGRRIARHRVDPLGQEISVLHLPDEAADVVVFPVQPQHGLRLDAAEDGVARHKVVVGDGRRVGTNPPGPADQSVGHHDLVRPLAAVHAGGPVRRHDEPVGLDRLSHFVGEHGQPRRSARPSSPVPTRPRAERERRSRLKHAALRSLQQLRPSSTYCFAAAKGFQRLAGAARVVRGERAKHAVSLVRRAVGFARGLPSRNRPLRRRLFDRRDQSQRAQRRGHVVPREHGVRRVDQSVAVEIVAGRRCRRARAARGGCPARRARR